MALSYTNYEFKTTYYTIHIEKYFRLGHDLRIFIEKNLQCYALLNFIFNTFLKVSFKKNTILLPKDFNDGTLRNLFWPCSKLSGARSSGYVEKGELGGHQTLLSYKSWPLMAFGCVRYEGHN